MQSMVYIMITHSWTCNYTATLRYLIFKLFSCFFLGGGGRACPQTPLRSQKFISPLHACKRFGPYKSPFFHTCKVDSSEINGQIRKLCNETDVGSIEGKQLNLCRGNIIFCHVDCFCLQERKKKEDEARSIFLLTRLRRPPQQWLQCKIRVHGVVPVDIFCISCK